MILQLIDLFQSHNDPARLRSTIRKLVAENGKLRLENAQLRHENRQLRRRLHDAELRLLRRAEADSVLLGALHFAGQFTSRRACLACGLSERRWTRAVALLRVARVHDGSCIDVETPEDFERALRIARERIERDGLDILRHRMPLCRR